MQFTNNHLDIFQLKSYSSFHNKLVLKVNYTKSI